VRPEPGARDNDLWEVAARDSRILTRELGPFDVSVVLGSGWAPLAGRLGELEAELPMQSLEGVPKPAVPGHGDTMKLVALEGRRVLVLTGRSHLYEGHPPATVVHAVRSSVMAGCGTVILTNAAGSLHPAVGVGTPVVITDQINLSGANPMAGPAPPKQFGSRFVDLTDLYDPALRAVAFEADPGAGEGVYAGVMGGSFETPAEIRMLASMGADLVGMSTVLEAIAARHLGASVFGVSLVTNLAAGLQPELDHLEVLEAAERGADRLVGMLRAVATAA
jgi:purine-nucleoside phosphorylase